MKHLINILKGVVIGIANAIPGVSGGTMMVILRVFDRLMDIIGSLTLKDIKKSFGIIRDNFVFLVTLAVGMVIGILGSATVLDYCFSHFYVQTQFFFLGIIAGSLPLILKEGTKDGKFRPIHIIPFLCGLAVMIAVTVADMNMASNEVYTSLTPSIFIYLTAVGAIAAAAMIMPGLSGSLVMLILGGYQTVIEALSADNIRERFPLLIPVAIGVVIGILGCAKVIKAVLAKSRAGLYAAILGLIFGSFYAIFPRETTERVIENGVEVTRVTGANFTFDGTGAAAVAMGVIGAAIPLIFMFMDKENKNA
ncbi:MAG: DUF368 domain-containing protein [Oscillospiraceae bacterium]|nr:DUF368 domain-containing protein [Oscillospiraceae bacterium]